MVLVTFGVEITKMLHNLCLHFTRQDWRDRKKWKENQATKITKIPKTKIWDERNLNIHWQILNNYGDFIVEVRS